MSAKQSNFHDDLAAAPEKPKRGRPAGRVILGLQTEFFIDYSSQEKSAAIVQPGERIRTQIMLESCTRANPGGDGGTNRYLFRDEKRNALLLYSGADIPLQVNQWTSAAITGGIVMKDEAAGTEISVAHRIESLTIPSNERLPDGHPGLKLNIVGKVQPAATLTPGKDPVLDQVKDRVETTKGLGRMYSKDLFEQNGRLLYCPKDGFDELSPAIIDHMVEIGFRRTRRYSLNDGEAKIPTAIMVHDCEKRRAIISPLAYARKALANYMDQRVQERNAVGSKAWTPVGGQFSFDFGNPLFEQPSLAPVSLDDDLHQARTATTQTAGRPEIL